MRPHLRLPPMQLPCALTCHCWYSPWAEVTVWYMEGSLRPRLILRGGGGGDRGRRMRGGGGGGISGLSTTGEGSLPPAAKDPLSLSPSPPSLPPSLPYPSILPRYPPLPPHLRTAVSTSLNSCSVFSPLRRSSVSVGVSYGTSPPERVSRQPHYLTLTGTLPCQLVGVHTVPYPSPPTIPSHLAASRQASPPRPPAVEVNLGTAGASPPPLPCFPCPSPPLPPAPPPPHLR